LKNHKTICKLFTNKYESCFSKFANYFYNKNDELFILFNKDREEFITYINTSKKQLEKIGSELKEYIDKVLKVKKLILDNLEELKNNKCYLFFNNELDFNILYDYITNCDNQEKIKLLENLEIIFNIFDKNIRDNNNKNFLLLKHIYDITIKNQELLQKIEELEYSVPLEGGPEYKLAKKNFEISQNTLTNLDSGSLDFK
jgi:hypothetical protein